MDCPVCASSRTDPLSTSRRSFHRCRTCGFSWADPVSRPDPAASRARYALHRNNASDPGYRSYMERIVDRALSWAAEGAAPGSGVRSAVDWGCGPEPLGARLLRSRGMEVVAWDPYFRQDERPAQHSVDLALCVEVAEHFFDPPAEFQAFARCLKPGGRALVHTHLAPEDDRAFLGWWYIEDPTHVSFYSPRSLEILAEYAALGKPRFEGGKFCLLRRPLPVLVVGGARRRVAGKVLEASYGAEAACAGVFGANGTGNIVGRGSPSGSRDLKP